MSSNKEKDVVADNGNNRSSSESEDGNDDEDVFTVEKIVGMKKSESGEVYYFIKWQGYDKPEDNTWEPEANVSHCDEILQTFLGEREKARQEEKNKKKKAAKSPPPPPKQPERSETAPLTPATAVAGRKSDSSGGSKDDRRRSGTDPAAAAVPPAADPGTSSVTPSSSSSVEDRKKSSSGGEKRKRDKDDDNKRGRRENGFTRGQKAKRILGACMEEGQLHFLVEWSDVADADLIPSKIVSRHIPYKVIQFYEDRLIWKD